MRLAAYVITVTLLAVVQSSFFGEIRVFGIIPNLLLVLIILNGLYTTASSTVAISIGGGLLLDLASGQDFGTRMAFFTFIALSVIVVRQLGFQIDGLWMLALLTTVGTLAFNVVILAGISLIEIQLHGMSIARIIGVEILINCLLAMVAQSLLTGLGAGSNRGEPGLRKRTILMGR